MVNAVEDCVASESDTGSQETRSAPPAAAAPVAAQPGETRPREAGSGRSFEGRLLSRLITFLGDPHLEFVLWTGESVRPAIVAEPVAQIRIADRAALYGLLADPQVRFGESYSDGRIGVEGDLVRVLEAVYQASTGTKRRFSVLRRGVEMMRRRRVNTLHGSRDNIHHHYDIGNKFYSLWLGRTMAYTCAYYPTATTTLDEAQVAKMDHVCRKMRLKADERVVEAGCGWGSLAIHMAQHYGVKVRAFNISQEQVAFARERAQREGLGSRVEFVLDDYRNITGKYDAFVSVGMLEHVGVENYPALGRVISHCLGNVGRGLIHSIGRNFPAQMHPWIEKRIFPGAHPPSLGEMMQIFEPWNLSILDVENIRLHYARTLRHWLELYEGASDKVAEMFDEKFVRMWRMYLSGSIAAFTTGTLQLFQVVFASQENNSIPWTRDHLYR